MLSKLEAKGMVILGWILIIALFAVGLAGAVYPILPGALAIYLAFLYTAGSFRSDRLESGSGLSRPL